MEEPLKFYTWIVSQDGEHRIRKWDVKPFDEATHVSFPIEAARILNDVLEKKILEIKE